MATTDTVWIKDPDAVLDWKFDWANTTNGGTIADWLDIAGGETISTRTVTVSSGLTKDSDSLTDSDTSVTVWLSGGTAGQDYTVSCLIATSAARTDERSVTIKVRER